ncbi:regucalcin-like [Triplophysa dalaica]|uniref:regucalcin-like n=1 Tax=Triplophysa dalaica TaxID=1582913 RepID=UPI0024DFDECB|nr:regucalcin-like [Triplophysa dalaica]
MYGPIGCQWVACYHGGRDLRIDPQTGTRLQTVKVAGGKDRADLYVTITPFKDMDGDSLAIQPSAGCLFKVTGVGVTAIPSF